MANSRLKSLLLSATMLFAALSLFAAPKFTAFCPEKVSSGQTFEYRIKLAANSWQNFSRISFPGDINLVDYRYDQGKEASGESTVSCITLIYTLKIETYGHFTLPIIDVTAEGKNMTSPVKKVEVVPEEDIADEYYRAFNKLESEGARMEDIHLKKMYSSPTITIFSDQRGKRFAVVTRKNYTDCVGGDGILAWSTEAQLASDNGPLWVFTEYENQLEALKTGRSTLYRSNVPCRVDPLLGLIQWGQGKPYNSRCPRTGISEGEPMVAGCGPIAMAQVMMYYKYPDRGEKEKVFKINGSLYRQNLAELEFDWSLIRENYENVTLSSENLYPIANLILAAGASVDADFGKDNTSSSAQNYRAALVNHFGYSPSAFYFSGNGTADRIAMTQKELQARRPVIIAGITHAFICDGMQDEFFHYNLGWYGGSNGWYRILLAEDGDLAFNCMVAGIEPKPSTGYKIRITLSRGDHLRSHLSEDEILNTSSLEIEGSLDSDDIALLRQMAGGVDETDCESLRGRLEYLDLSKAKFVDKGSGYYLRRSAKGYTSWIETIVGRRTFDFNKMSQRDWEDFVSLGLSKGDGYYFENDNGNYYICYQAKKAEVGSMMWCGCGCLKELILPADIKKIGDYAFAECTCLQRFDIPDNCTIGKAIFRNCKVIEEVTYNGLAQTKQEDVEAEVMFEGANPVYRISSR